MKSNGIRFVGLLLVFAALMPAGPRARGAEVTSDMTALRLRCEYRKNPEGIAEARPRLSWIVQARGRSRAQSAYRILAAASPEALNQNDGGLWDSGKVLSDRTVLVPYAGKPLGSGRQCFWKVMAWDEQGRPSAWSEPAKWSMGLLEPGDWQAQWIGFDRPWSLLPRDIYVPATVAISLFGKDVKVYLPCPFLRKSFTLDRKVKRATAHAAALGIFELHINGARVGNDFFTPGWTDYNQRVYYLTYDVTGLLHDHGENVAGAILADGWYAGNLFNRGQRQYGSKLRLRLQINLEYEDGTTEVVATDRSWRASAGPIREADIQAGEVYDARMEMAGWSEPGFDDHGWNKVNLTEKVSAKIEPYPGLPVRAIQEIPPIERTEPKPGIFVFNLGQNFAGRAKIRVRGEAGDKVVLRFGEMKNPDGTVYTENLRSARATDTYILKGGGLETWEPRFTFHGFQYVEVEGWPGEPGLDDVTGVVLHSDLPETGSIKTSHPLVNKIFSNIRWGQKSNYFEVPTDCPQRDERLGWTGDAQVFIRAGSYNMDIGAFFTKWLVDLDDGQDSRGAYPSVAPKVTPGIAAGWGDAGVICPWTIFHVYGDHRVLERHYPAMTRWITYLEKRSLNYVSPPLGFEGDWLNIDDPTPKNVIATAYFAHDAGLMADMARAIGRDDDARRYEELFEKIRAAFQNAFVSGDGRVKGDSQTGYLMAIAFKLVEGELREKCADRLIEKIQDNDWRLSTGFLGCSLLLPVLTDVGRTDVAYRLLTSTRYPSWGYSIAQGATTVWERWNSYTVENGFGPVSMNSFNHYAFGAVGQWMYMTMAGIDTDGPGFKRIIIRPRPGGELTWVNAEYDSIRGRISSRWRLEGDDLHLEVTIPANAAAEVFVPADGPESVTEGGRPAAESEGVRFLRMEDGAAVFETGSGTYGFISNRGSDARGAAD